MRAKLLHHSTEWLEQDFERPPELGDAREISFWHMQRVGSMLALKTNKGSGLWTSEGRLLRFSAEAADLQVIAAAEAVVELVNVFGRCTVGEGVRHQVHLRDLRQWTPRGSIELCVPMGGAEYLVLSPDARSCLATWLDQQQWGYVGVDLVNRVQTTLAFEFGTPTLNIPAYTSDGRFVIACNRHRRLWWADDPDDWDAPCPGGERLFGTISVQDTATCAVTLHELVVELPKGWIPKEADDPDWETAWGPEILSAEQFRIWLPDHTPLTLTLPLPERILLKTPLRKTRSD
jgi:hypothetical protein